MENGGHPQGVKARVPLLQQGRQSESPRRDSDSLTLRRKGTRAFTPAVPPDAHHFRSA